MCELMFVSSFIFRQKVGFLNSRLILGAKQQVVLIYRDFISWQECFRMAALYLLPPAPGHVGIPSSVVLMSERKLMFSIKDAVSWRERGWETSPADNKRKADEITVSTRSPMSKTQVLLAGLEGRRPSDNWREYSPDGTQITPSDRGQLQGIWTGWCRGRKIVDSASRKGIQSRMMQGLFTQLYIKTNKD